MYNNGVSAHARICCLTSINATTPLPVAAQLGLTCAAIDGERYASDGNVQGGVHGHPEGSIGFTRLRRNAVNIPACAAMDTLERRCRVHPGVSGGELLQWQGPTVAAVHTRPTSTGIAHSRTHGHTTPSAIEPVTFWLHPTANHLAF